MNCAKQFADPEGKAILQNFIDASREFNDYMEPGNQAESFKMLHQANDAFAAVAPHIKNPYIKAFFLKTYKEFGAELATKNIDAVNAYMEKVVSSFKAALGQAAKGM